MNWKVLLLAIFLSAILVQGAVLKREEDETNSRQKRTLGLLTVGANALSDGVGTAGVLAGTAIAAVSAIKPLLLLGIGKYYLWNWLKSKSTQPTAGFGVNLNAGPGFGFDANIGLNEDYGEFSDFQPADGYWNDAPVSTYTKGSSDTVSWAKKRSLNRKRR